MRGPGTGQEKMARVNERKLQPHCDLNTTSKQLTLEELRPAEVGRSRSLMVAMVGLERRHLS
jgi:hypothetical protein